MQISLYKLRPTPSKDARPSPEFCFWNLSISFTIIKYIDEMAMSQSKRFFSPWYCVICRDVIQESHAVRMKPQLG